MKKSENVLVAGVSLAPEVYELMQSVGADVLDDFLRLRSMRCSAAQLLEECLRGCENETDAIWVGYVQDIVNADITIAGALCAAAKNDVQFVAERGRGPHLTDEFQSWHEVTTYYLFADGSCARFTDTEAEEISIIEYQAAVDREDARSEYEMGCN